MHPVVDVHCTIGQEQDVPLRAEQLLGMMDRCGIGKAVLSPPHQYMAVDNPVGNNQVLAYTRRYPERFLGYASVNPWYGGKAVTELRRALDAGLSGVAFHPALQGFFVFDRRKMDSLMEVVEQYRVPVYIHTGTPVFALPLQVAELALQHPSVPFIMGRMGNTDFWIDAPHAFAMADNIYIDTPYTSPANLLKLIRADCKRVLFSADLPYSHAGIEREKLEHIGLTPDEWWHIATDNFRRIFIDNTRIGNGGADNTRIGEWSS